MIGWYLELLELCFLLAFGLLKFALVDHYILGTSLFFFLYGNGDVDLSFYAYLFGTEENLID